MESAGAQCFFQSPLDKYNIRYALYIGDSDTESFKKVLESKPYRDDLISCKLECAGRVKKKIGNKITKFTKWQEGKKIEGWQRDFR